ncbi:OmpA family protein [Myxococcus landrumensis]|uniref:OmpA family protein n=1 Tax=Myxococcus landrumensis TaxID=2813577 RepID=A0ABX7MZD8_9BACT|nr:OmpA family protein [Myxococcus landrumus]QSQ11646.1 OmpA family protein [Myxococcus landrumus]
MVRNKRGWKALAGATLLLAAGSASASPPKELEEARAAYKQLAASPQGRESPREVQVAKAALKAAETSYKHEKDSTRTRVLSYVALRRIETAGTWGNASLASRQQSEAQAAIQQAQAQQQEGQRRQQLDAEAQRLAQQNEEIQRQAERRQAEEMARSQAEQQTTAQLDAERKAREEAEQKAAAALAELDKANKDLKVREEARGTVLTLSGSVLFASGSSELLPSARDRLSDVADVLKEGEKPLLIEGHTDSTGSDSLNERLSYQRAERVKDFLVTRGVPAQRIDVRGLGEYQPVATNATAEGRANNRRVEIIVERGGQRAVGGSGQQDSSGQPQQQQPADSNPDAQQQHESHDSGQDVPQ